MNAMTREMMAVKNGTRVGRQFGTQDSQSLLGDWHPVQQLNKG